MTPKKRLSHSNKISWLFVSGLILIAATLSVASTPSARSASQQKLFISWGTDTLVPNNFWGKALPTANSRINASLTLIDNGRVVDLSNQAIYWYLGEELISDKAGATKISFSAPASSQAGTFDLRAEIPNYGESLPIQTRSIPIVRPEAVIELRSPGGAVSWSPIDLFARGFFFNVKKFADLSASWAVNGKPPDSPENPEILTINIPDSLPNGTKIQISLKLENSKGFLESVSSDKRITLEK